MNMTNNKPLRIVFKIINSSLVLTEEKLMKIIQIMDMKFQFILILTFILKFN